MKKINIKVNGMHCASCEMLVTDSLKELEGVKEASAIHKKSTVTVVFDETKTDESKIKSIIIKEGYKV